MSDAATEQKLELLTDPVTGKIAPKVLWRPLRRLAGSVDRVTSAVATCLQDGDRTEWAVVLVTNRALVHGRASKALPGEIWSSESADQSCDDVSVWSRGLDHIQSIDTAQLAVQHHRPGSGDESLTWTEAYQVGFLDGTVLDLPLFNSQAGGGEVAKPALAVLDTLVAQLDARSTGG
ncbi:hypothetical protein [Nocardioides sp. SR21]|uniref:hypothetical protein n=1 Tax=Nocardioides sp. SR21 TaxID=2919501 RepID=UPI001FAA602C|nr:hypothetical protein [Nocardioides sp. SR21]